MISEKQRRCAVVGQPIAHSLSPTLHRAAYAEVGLAWEYDACEVSRPALRDFLDGLDDTWRGLSLTMPLKRTVVPLVDELSERAWMAQAANTVLFDEGRRQGENTDIPGAMAAIRERTSDPVRRAVILGGGATATSSLLALTELGCEEVTLVVRDMSRAAETLAAAARHRSAPEVRVARFDLHPVAADILVSTIPAAAQQSSGVRFAESVPVVFDVIYDPWPTPLARFASQEGRTLVAGLDLLVHQAGLQFTLMTGLDAAPLDVMRTAGEQALADRTDTS